MKEHHFDIEDAKKHGVEKAILLYNLKYWLEKNKANNKNVHEHKNGKKYYWTFNSASAFSELFPYLNPKSITRWLRELEQQNVIISSNHNKHRRDRTKWYTMSNFSITQCARGNDQSDPCNDQSDPCNDQSDPPLPNSKPDKKPNNIYISEIYELYILEINSKSRLTSGAKKKIETRLKEFSVKELTRAIMNFSRDRWWMSHNAQRGVAWFFNSEDRIDQFLNLEPEDRKEKLNL